MENIELLKFISKNSEMGMFTITELLKDLKDKDNKIKLVIQKQLKEFEKYYKESKKLLEKNKQEVKTNGMMAKMGASMGIKKETKNDNSDSSMAQMLIEGITMGTVEIEAKIKDYEKVADKKIITLAKDYLETLTKQIEELKKYL